jgi:hypothetical protein
MPSTALHPGTHENSACYTPHRIVNAPQSSTRCSGSRNIQTRQKEGDMRRIAKCFISVFILSLIVGCAPGSVVMLRTTWLHETQT